MLTRKPDTRTTGLPLDLIDLMLGVDRPEVEIDALIAEGIPYDTFLLFFVSAADLAELRREHAVFLAAEAARRGIQFPKEGQ